MGSVGIITNILKSMLIFILQGYEHEEVDGRLTDVVTVELIGEKMDEVISRAKKIVKKKFWRLSNIIEKEDGNP